MTEIYEPENFRPRYKTLDTGETVYVGMQIIVKEQSKDYTVEYNENSDSEFLQCYGKYVLESRTPAQVAFFFNGFGLDFETMLIEVNDDCTKTWYIEAWMRPVKDRGHKHIAKVVDAYSAHAGTSPVYIAKIPRSVIRKDGNIYCLAEFADRSYGAIMLPAPDKIARPLRFERYIAFKAPSGVPVFERFTHEEIDFGPGFGNTRKFLRLTSFRTYTEDGRTVRGNIQIGRPTLVPYAMIRETKTENMRFERSDRKGV